MEETIVQLILAFAMKYPITMAILAVMGTLRAIFKPIMSVAHAYVESTSSLNDDEVLKKIEGHKAFKAFAWFIDYIASIKIGPQAPK
jgi:hypothetical protein